MEEIIQNFESSSAISIDHYSLLFSFILCIIASLVLKHVYNLKSSSLTGKYHVGSIIPMLSLTTFLVITVVKSSLALSLGLVGALSVIRFRTPIKEPEELVYLFLSIAIGLGYGAGQFLITTICFLIIVFCIFFIFNRDIKIKTNDYNLIFNWQDQSIKSTEIIEILKNIVSDIDLIKFDNDNANSYTLYLKVVVSDLNQIQKIENKFSNYKKDLSFSLYESKILS